MRLDLRCRPRDENAHAEDLTNERFLEFDPSLRIQFDFEDFPSD